MSSESFYSYANEMVESLLERYPVLATYLGEHRFDHLLADNSPEAVEQNRKWLGELEQHLEGYNTADWQTDAAIDHTLTLHLIKQFIRQFDHIYSPDRDPMDALNECTGGVYALIINEYAPIEDRLMDMLGRLQQIPRVLREGRALVIPENVPPIWAEVALETAQQGTGLVGGLVPMLAENAPKIKSELLEASEKAAEAFTEHTQWLQEKVIPNAEGSFPVGKDLFNDILSMDHMVDYDADQLLETGWELLQQTKEEMEQVAVSIDPSKTVEELLEESKKDHPTADDLLDAYRRAMDEAKQVVIDKDIASIPEGEEIRIEPTPAFMRPMIPYGAYMPPGFLEKKQEGIFIVTPVEEGSDAEEAEKKLRGHGFAKIPVVALHEAYPGHHLQLTTANKVGTTMRKLGGFLSSLFIEGWAFYCEELMEELGYIDQPIQKLARLQAQLWRAARIVLDVSLHTRQMTVDEAVDFLVEKAHLEPDDATVEVNRYTQTAGQPQSYLMGKIEIMRIVEEYKKRFPDSTMKEMHDAMLICGSLPPRLMRLKLFGSA